MITLKLVAYCSKLAEKKKPNDKQTTMIKPLEIAKPNPILNTLRLVVPIILRATRIGVDSPGRNMCHME